MADKFYITIGRQVGSGGRPIGEIVAAQLGISFYDKELINIASRETGIGKEFFDRMDEKESHSIFSGLFGLGSSSTDDIYSSYYLSAETLFKIQSDVIRQLADEQSSLFVGRCADYVLKEYPRCLNVFISADKRVRIRRIMEMQGMTEHQAKDFIEKMDKKRAAYYNYYADKNWGAAASYHLCVNSSVLGIVGTAEYIRLFAEKRFGL